ncbi:hypothetical protein NMY22_g13453 [Coprinellus aureogranulatus]|nr:hypothetical protein NMY22_g13453 [Coprinellus aureogranulatus]
MLQLPQEILDTIVDLTALESPESLRALSIASRCFLERTRSHIFRTIYFFGPLRVPGATKGIFLWNPSLLKYVRRVSVINKPFGFDLSETDVQDGLNHLTHLEALKISVLDELDLEAWSKIGLLDCGPQLLHLSIGLREDTPLQFFLSLARLQELRITYYTSYARWGIFQITNPSHDIINLPWRLRSLHYHPYVPQPCPILRCPQIFQQLVHLSLVIKYLENHYFIFSSILPACQGSPLRTLRLQYGEDSKVLSPLVLPCLQDWKDNNHSLPPFSSLRCFAVLFHTYDSPWPGSCRQQLEYVSAMLGDTTQPSLETLELTLSWLATGESPPEGEWENPAATAPCWAQLDSALSSCHLLPAFRAVRITSQAQDPMEKHQDLSTDETDTAHTLREQLLAAVPQVRNRGLLVDAGSRETRRAFDSITGPLYDGAWRYT